MPLSNRLVGRATDPVSHEVGARWLMAYAAGVGDDTPCYFDTTKQLAMHPVFPVCLEWDPILALRFGPGTESMTSAEQACAVHADHDLHLLGPLRPGARLITTATAIAVEQRKPGAFLLKRLDTVDEQGQMIARTYQGTLYRGVSITGENAAIETPPAWPAFAGGCVQQFTLAVPLNAAHVYTECAKIWNPIHTDRAQALAAGLPEIILHGTATLALAVSRLVREYLGGDPRAVTRLGGRFSAMVTMPTTLALEVVGHTAGAIGFRVTTPEGKEAVRLGFLEYHT